MKNFLLRNVVPAQILFERGLLRQSERRVDSSTGSPQVFF